MVYKSKYPAVSIPEGSIPEFLFEQNPTKGYEDVPAFIDGISGRTITFAQQRIYVERLAAALAQPASFGYSFKPVTNGSVVAVFSPNHVLYPTALWGILRAGGIATTANAVYTVTELVHQLKDSGATVMVTHPSVIQTALAAAKESGLPESAIVLFEHDENTKKWPTVDQLLAAGEKVPPLPKLVFAPGESAKRPAFICYSSGTTGLAKGTLISHANVKWNVAQFIGFEGRSGFRAGVDKLLGLLPMSHIYSLVVIVHIGTFAKATTVVLPRFELPVFLTTIDKYQITKMHIVPPIVIALAKHPLVDSYSMASVEDVFSGAAPLGKEVSDELVQRMAKLRGPSKKPPVLRQGWGMTETATVVTANPIGKVKGGAVGEVLPNIEVRLVDPDTGKDAAPGAEGEIWVRGPNVVLGYLNNPKANAETFDKEGYLHTGDIGRMDEDGYLYITDRLKELIKVKGLQVAPAELEALLLSHPIVADAAVIPIPDERAGELPRACVVLKDQSYDKEKATTEISKFVQSKLARHKWLDGGIEFMPEGGIPKSASGKILRRFLRDAQREKLKAKL